MSESKITTNRIEEVLLNKAKLEYISEICKATSRLVDVLNNYRPRTENEADIEAFKTWVTSLFTVTYRVFTQDSNIGKLPECIEKALLNDAVNEFLQSIESTKNQIEELCNYPQE